jgi:SNF2 family DNA or RNA helicase
MLWLSKASIVQTGGTFNEAARWFPELKIFPIKGSDNRASRDLIFKTFAPMGGICVLTNYETIRTTPAASDIHWDFLIMDEVHKLKGGANANGPTAIWESIKGLDVGFQMMLTGTPLVNKIEEIWSYLHLFDPQAFPDSRRFARQFSAFKDLSGKLQFSLQSERLLKDILKGRLIRRTATEVGLQLPPVNYETIVLPHNLEQGDLYNKMRDDFFIWLDKQEGKTLSAMSILAQLTRLRQINVLPVANFKWVDHEGIEQQLKLDVRDSSKLDEAVEIVQKTNDQVIIFSNFNEPMKELAFRLQVEGISSAIISSETASKMGTYETDFQAGKLDVLLINIQMGEGMNLHKDSAKWPGGARAVIMLDFWWNDAKNRQCVARAVRPGETAGEPVFVYKLMVENSVDFFIQALCDEKSAQFDAITESSELRPKEDWQNYLKGLL